MICKSCREAGTLNHQLDDEELWQMIADLEEAGLIDYVDNRERLRAEAEKLHESCPGGTWCDCHHRVNGINWPAIELAERRVA